MFDVTLMRGALTAFSTLFGSLGVFFLYFSFINPNVSAYALIFLGTATAIVFSTGNGSSAPVRRRRPFRLK